MPDPLKQLYDRSSAFGRDFFHYVVAALVLAVALVIGLLVSGQELPVPDGLAQLSASWVAVAAIVGVVSLYGVGHVLLQLGSLINELWRKSFRNWEHVQRYEKARRKVTSIATRLLDRSQETVVDDDDCHVVAEMVALKYEPDLHARFVERYNTLLYMRLGLAASLVVAGLATGALAICLSWQPKICRGRLQPARRAGSSPPLRQIKWEPGLVS